MKRTAISPAARVLARAATMEEEQAMQKQQWLTKLNQEWLSTHLVWVPRLVEYLQVQVPIGFCSCDIINHVTSVMPHHSCHIINHAMSVMPNHTCACKCVHDACLVQANLVHFYILQYMWIVHVSMCLMHASMCHPQVLCEFLHVLVHIQRSYLGSHCGNPPH